MRNGSAVFGPSFGTITSIQALRGESHVHENGNAAETSQPSGNHVTRQVWQAISFAHQDKKTRLTGVDAIKSHIFIAKNVGDVIKSS